jgi:UDP-N-acetylmuramoylalanine--D-glutamate ligase
MTEVTGFRGKTVGVFGLARSGLSAIPLKAGGAGLRLGRQGPPPHGCERSAMPSRWERWPWRKMGALILSPGVPLTHPQPHAIVRRARDAGAEVIGDVELFARTMRLAGQAKNAAPIIAVTGTNGKSTTTALIGHILQSCGLDAQVGGNIGRPALDLAAPGPNTVYVLEVSSYQIDLAPGLISDVALLTNLSPDHIDRHGTMAGYAAVKEKLLVQTAADGYVAVGVDDADSAVIYTKLAAHRGLHAVAVSVGKVLGRGIFVIDGKLYDSWDQPAAEIGDLKTATHLPGAHNWQNAALAYAALRPLLRDPRAIMQAINRFPGLAIASKRSAASQTNFINESRRPMPTRAPRRSSWCYRPLIAGGKRGGSIAS